MATAPTTTPHTAFTGFRPEAVEFLAELAQNNDRTWFTPRKGEFERLLKEPMEELCVALEQEFRARDIPLHADPVRSPFRIYRDVRFSKDKRPYKTAVAASFAWAGDGTDAASGRSHADNVHASGGYFHLQPGDIFVGGGVWRPDPSWLRAFRQRLVDDLEGFRSIVEAPAFVAEFGSIGDDGESLKRVPTGFPPDHPAADLLRQKNVTFGRRLSDDEALSRRLPTIIADAFAVATPLLRYLAAVGRKASVSVARSARPLLAVQHVPTAAVAAVRVEQRFDAVAPSDDRLEGATPSRGQQSDVPKRKVLRGRQHAGPTTSSGRALRQP